MSVRLEQFGGTCPYLWLLIAASFCQCGSTVGIGLTLGRSTDGKNSSLAVPVPEFVIEPQDAYVLKNHPATLTCMARLVTKLEFNCSGGFHLNNTYIKQSSDEGGVTSLSTKIYRHMIKSIGQVTCFCAAFTSSSGTLNSKTATFTLAYLRVNIGISPSKGIRIHKNGTVNLKCHSPDGIPEPQTILLKDGYPVINTPDGRVKIQKGDSVTVAINGTLVSDTGAYQCVAYNMAGRRESGVIQLTVYVDGGWSDWFEFAACDAKCGNGTMFLQRSCTNPAPQNGGQFCMGSRIKEFPCQDICKDIEIYCPEDITEHVNQSHVAYAIVSWEQPRVVNNRNGTTFSLLVTPVWAKPPMSFRVSQQPHVIRYTAKHENGQEASCSFNITVYNSSASVKCDICTPTRKRGNETPGSGTTVGASAMRVPLIIGSAIAVIVIIALVALSRAFYKHGKGFKSKKNLTVKEKGDADFPSLITRSGSYVEAMVGPRDLKSPSPIETRTIELYPMKRQPNVNSQTAQQIKEEVSSDKDHTFGRSNSCVSNKSTVSEISRMMWNISNLPENADQKQVAWGLIDHNGGKLEIGNTGVSLTVPHLAIPEGHTEGIYIALMKQDADHPRLTSTESMLSPVVMCGPNGIKFDRPVILSMPHCALLQDGAWNLRVQYNDNEPTAPAEWKPLVDVNKQDGSESSFVIMEPSMCHLMVDHFTDFVLMGESASGKQAVRMVQLVAYVTPPEANKDCVVRVYCVADTPAAIEAVHSQETEKFGGHTIDAPKPLFFKDGGGHLLVKILSHQEGWENKSGEEKKIRFLHIWNGIERMPSCTFMFSVVDQGVAQFRGTFEVRQDCEDGDEQEVNVVAAVKKGPEDKPVSLKEARDDFIRNMNCACTMSTSLRNAASVASLEDASAGSLQGAAGPVLSTRRSFLSLDNDAAQAVCPISPAVSPLELKHLSFSSGYSSNGCQSLLSVHSLSQELRNDLVFTLDPPHTSDWRLLAEKLGFESKHIRWLESRKDSPTETLLNWWEMKRSRKFPLRKLAEILREMGRDDAAVLIEAHLPRETVV